MRTLTPSGLGEMGTLTSKTEKRTTVASQKKGANMRYEEEGWKADPELGVSMGGQDRKNTRTSREKQRRALPSSWRRLV